MVFWKVYPNLIKQKFILRQFHMIHLLKSYISLPYLGTSMSTISFLTQLECRIHCLQNAHLWAMISVYGFHLCLLLTTCLAVIVQPLHKLWLSVNNDNVHVTCHQLIVVMMQSFLIMLALILSIILKIY